MERLLQSLIIGLFGGLVLYVFKAPIWACIGFTWILADNAILYLRLKDKKIF